MSNNFSNAHVFVGRQGKPLVTKNRLIELLSHHVTEGAFEPVGSSSEADRTVCVSTEKNGWISIFDTGGPLVECLVANIDAPVLLVYCEASERVCMELFVRGESGGWGIEALPQPHHVEELLVEGCVAPRNVSLLSGDSALVASTEVHNNVAAWPSLEIPAGYEELPQTWGVTL
ncbi:MAG: hypothetical protein HN348_16645 [Proteobacteria bacterium]|jgi:hypothetical protein|nr:hypothetical protein [Pseudomonadota bacterium]